MNDSLLDYDGLRKIFNRFLMLFYQKFVDLFSFESNGRTRSVLIFS